MIAMAIGCSPRLVIADEPTTALDVTVQARILALIDGLRAESKMAILLVSHDLAVIAGHCDRVIVMYAGMIMESGPVEAVLRQPRNPYTLALLGARPAARRSCAALGLRRSRARRRLRNSIPLAALSLADARSPSTSAVTWRRPRLCSKLAMFPAVIAPAK